MSKKEHKDGQENPNAEQLVDEQEQPFAEGRESEGATGAEAPESPASAEEEREALRRENEELREKYLRLFAEFDNYKKRTIREKIDLMNTAAQDTMAALLPVLDDFDRAKKIADDPHTTETFSEGVGLVYQKLYNVLRQKGLEPMNTTGERFDPELHEAITEIPAPSEEAKGIVIDTVEKGYKLKDKIIRHAKVVVGK